MTRTRILVIIIFVVTVGLGAAAVYIGMRLGQEDEVTPEGSGAASQEVWDASLVKTEQEREAFAAKWRTLEESDDFSFETAKAFALGEGARFRSDAPILSVADETLYGRDLNYYLFFHAYNSYISAGALTDADVDPIIDKMISDSIVLQKAAELALITLSDDVFNNLNKNFTQRNTMITNNKDRVMEEYVEIVEGEAIFIWYRNSVVPVDVETGREVAERKINELYELLNSGEITMVEAADRISNDQEILQQADPNAADNAYYAFRTEKNMIIPAFDDPDLESQLWALGEGQMSNVLVGKVNATKESLEAQGFDVADDFDENRDMYFTIIKVNKRSAGSKYESTDEFDLQEPDASVNEGESEILLQ